MSILQDLHSENFGKLSDHPQSIIFVNPDFQYWVSLTFWNYNVL